MENHIAAHSPGRTSMSHIHASGNIAADMPANVTAEASDRVLATRLPKHKKRAGSARLPAKYPRV
jgi:hypothetical protein